MRERLLFVGLLIGAAATVPLLASLFRARLRARMAARLGGGRPARRDRLLIPVRYGFSPRSRRSPRHAVLLYRGLMSAVFMALLALFLMPAVIALPRLGISAIPAAFAFALPTLLVTLLTRRRSLRE